MSRRSRHEEDCIVALDWLESSGDDHVKIGCVEVWRFPPISENRLRWITIAGLDHEKSWLGPEGGLVVFGTREAIRPAQLRAFITGEPFTWVRIQDRQPSA